MNEEQRLREIIRTMIREMIKHELDEMSTTAGAGPYLTPFAFRGNKKSQIARSKHIATDTTGFKLTPRGQQDMARPADKMEIVTKNLAEGTYYEYKNDESASPHKKIAKAISELNRNLQEVERVLKINTRLKNESGIASEQLWKRTQQGLIKLESRLLNIATRIREIRGQ